MAETKPPRIETLSGALPWILYFALPYAGLPLAAVLAGLAAALYPTAYAAARGRDVKLVDWTTLGFFAIGTIASAAGTSATAAFLHYNYVLMWILFGAMAWGSLLVGKPFTLQFARRSTPPEVWNTPLFHHANVIITLAWATAFTLDLLVALIALRLSRAAAIAAQIFQFVPMAGAVVFMKQYRATLQQQRAVPAQAPAG